MITSRKTIVFFDGDGTIWYPGSTKRSKPPYWIYGDTESTRINTESLKHLVLSDTALDALKELRRRNIKLIMLSTHPHPPKTADAVLRSKLKHLKIEDMFDEVYATGGNTEDKGLKIVSLLERYKLPKSSALMVGDSYHYDYLSAKAVGVDAVLLRSEYLKRPARGPGVKRLINEVEDVLEFV